MILTLLGPILPIHSILGSLLAYRAIYYLLPLGIAAALLGTHEAYQRKAEAKRAALLFRQWIPVLLPNVFALAIFVSGAILLFSGAIPVVNWRLTGLKDFIPLPVIEISHFLTSLVGVGLLFLARGLQRRLDGAYLLTLALLGTGVVLSLLKGFDYKEALVLVVMFSSTLPSRRHFYRRASLISQRFTLGWIAAIISCFACSVWLGIFSLKTWNFQRSYGGNSPFIGDAPRFLRATVGAIGAALFMAMARLLRPVPTEPPFPGMTDLERAVPLSKDHEKLMPILPCSEIKHFFSARTKRHLSCTVSRDEAG